MIRDTCGGMRFFKVCSADINKKMLLLHNKKKIQIDSKKGFSATKTPIWTVEKPNLSKISPWETPDTS